MPIARLRFITPLHRHHLLNIMDIDTKAIQQLPRSLVKLGNRLGLLFKCFTQPPHLLSVSIKMDLWQSEKTSPTTADDAISLDPCTPIVVVKMIINLLCGQGEKSIQTIPHSIKHPTNCNFSTQCCTWLTTDFYNHLQPTSREWTQDIQSSIYGSYSCLCRVRVSDREAAEKHLSSLLLEEWKTDHPKALWDEWVWQKVSLGS